MKFLLWLIHNFSLLNKSTSSKGTDIKSKASLLNKTESNIPVSTPLKTYNLQEELAGKYGKSHVFKVSSLSQFEKKVI